MSRSAPAWPLSAALVLLLAVPVLSACGGGGGGGGTPSPTPTPTPPPPSPEPLPVVTISGRAQYQFVPARANCQGLNFEGTLLRPIRQATVEALDPATSALLDSAVIDDNGDFALSVAADSAVFLRVRAELKRAGLPAWDLEVRDNFDDTEPPAGRPPLAQRPLYVLDGASFNAGSSNSTRNLTATTGWGSNSYVAARAAAPFAILDTIYAGMLLVLGEDPEAVFAPLDAFWSVNNAPTGGDEPDIDLGELGTSFYSDSQLFLLGLDGADTEEFDDHVIAHEWGHYFEDAFSRSDSVGGAHSIGDRLDMRVAFGEGWATALSGIALNSPEYCDTQGAGNQSGFRIAIEDPGAIGQAGWYNELSVMKIVYDLWDEDVDGPDSMSIGFAPIYRVMTGAQAATPALTSIFSFATALKAENPNDSPFIDALLAAENIAPAGIDAYGSTETNGAGAVDVLPVFTTVQDGVPFEICSNSQFDRSGGTLNADGNKLSEYRYLRMTLATAARLDVEILTTPETRAMLPPDDPDDDHDRSDPDILIARSGVIQNQFVNGEAQGLSGDADQEIFTTPNPLPAGDYAMSLIEFRYDDTLTAAGYPAQSCFDVTITTIP